MVSGAEAEVVMVRFEGAALPGWTSRDEVREAKRGRIYDENVELVVVSTPLASIKGAGVGRGGGNHSCSSLWAVSGLIKRSG